jgi:hypothetical protein
MRSLVAAALLACATAARAQDMPDMAGMDHSKMAHDAPPTAATPTHDMAGMEGMDMSRPMAGAYGPYAMSREASGTSWQPDASPDEGIHLSEGAWLLILQGLL